MARRPLLRLLVLLLLGVVHHAARAFENPLAGWLETVEDDSHEPHEEAESIKVQQQQHHDEGAENHLAAVTAGDEGGENEEQQQHYREDELKVADEELNGAEHQPLHRDTEPSWDAFAEKQREETLEDRRLSEEVATATEVWKDEPDEFAGLEGLDLSPFNMYIADKAVLVRLLDWAYDRVAHLSRFSDGFVHAEELGRLFYLALNPTEENVPSEYIDLVDAAADEMRVAQGLLDDEMAMPRGFIGRGMPLRSLQRLAQQMHEHHSWRRLTEVAPAAGTRASEL